MTKLRLASIVGVVCIFAFLESPRIGAAIEQTHRMFNGGPSDVTLDEAMREKGSSSIAGEAQVDSALYVVDRVIDGDTFDLSRRDGTGGKMRVRLIGIDAPETKSGSKLSDQAREWRAQRSEIKRAGLGAKRTATRLVEGRTVYLEMDGAYADQGHKGRYGRTLAYVWVAGEQGRPAWLVNEEMIRRGKAVATDYDNYRYVRRFEAIEKRVWETGGYPWQETR